MARSDDFRGGEARLDWTPDLFKARAQEVGKKPKHGVSLLYAKAADISNIVAAVKAAAVEEWGEAAADQLAKGIIRSPILDGDGKAGFNKKTQAQNPACVGHYLIRATANEDHKPLIVDRLRNPVVSVAGCKAGWYGFPVIHAFTWDHPLNGKGVSIGITLLQVTREGEVLSNSGGGSPDPDKFFEKIADEGAAPAETKSGQGAGGLFG